MLDELKKRSQRTWMMNLTKNIRLNWDEENLIRFTEFMSDHEILVEKKNHVMSWCDELKFKSELCIPDELRREFNRFKQKHKHE